jgi:hypothetical protein
MTNYDTGFQVVIEAKSIYPGDTYFKDVFKEDETEWVASQGAKYRVLDQNSKEIDTGDLSLSVDGLALQLRYAATTSWVPGQKYRLLVNIYDTATGYSDTVLEVNFRTR